MPACLPDADHMMLVSHTGHMSMTLVGVNWTALVVVAMSPLQTSSLRAMTQSHQNPSFHTHTFAHRSWLLSSRLVSYNHFIPKYFASHARLLDSRRSHSRERMKKRECGNEKTHANEQTDRHLTKCSGSSRNDSASPPKTKVHVICHFTKAFETPTEIER